jgi:excisionase family DNA binding protein
LARLRRAEAALKEGREWSDLRSSGRHRDEADTIAAGSGQRGHGEETEQVQLLHRATLADFLAVSDRTIRNWIRSGKLPSYKFGAARRIDPTDVEDFLARHRDEAA